MDTHAPHAPDSLAIDIDLPVLAADHPDRLLGRMLPAGDPAVAHLGTAVVASLRARLRELQAEVAAGPDDRIPVVIPLVGRAV